MIRNVILLIVLLLQTGAWFLIDPPWSDGGQATAGFEEEKLDALPLDSVSRVRISAPGGKTLTLSLAEGVWGIDEAFGFPADADRVARALGELEALPRAELRSRKAVMHETFDVDEEKATSIVLQDAAGAEVANVLVGKRDVQGIQGTFARLAGDERVFVVPSQNLASAFPVEPSAWYGLYMMDVDITDQVRVNELRQSCYRIEIEVRIDGEDGETSFARRVYERVDPRAAGEDRDAYWRVLEPEGKEELVLDDLLLKNMVSNIVGVRAYSLVGPGVKPEYGLDDPDSTKLRVTARFREDGGETVRVLEVGEEIPVEEGAPPQTNRLRYARVSHPGDPVRQRFVFGVSSSFPVYYEREPEAFQRRELKPEGKGEGG